MHLIHHHHHHGGHSRGHGGGLQGALDGKALVGKVLAKKKLVTGKFVGQEEVRCWRCHRRQDRPSRQEGLRRCGLRGQESLCRPSGPPDAEAEVLERAEGAVQAGAEAGLWSRGQEAGAGTGVLPGAPPEVQERAGEEMLPGHPEKSPGQGHPVIKKN